MYDEKFLRQVELLLRCLPALRNQDEFAIKGGTAINLLMLDLPRLSVDIDLTFSPIVDREISLKKMHEGLNNIKTVINKQNPEVRIIEKLTKDKLITKLFVHHGDTMIKIEPSFIQRGTLHPIQHGSLSKKVNEVFKIHIDEIPMLSTSELYAGKLCAALDRQHPRDLFDVKMLFETGGITDEMRKAFVIYLAGNGRPMHELLAPNRLDIKHTFENEFVKMTESEIGMDDLLNAREQLIAYIQETLTDSERKFLLSVKLGAPEYDLMPFKNLDQLPALRWKLMNIGRMDKRRSLQMTEKLKAVLGL